MKKRYILMAVTAALVFAVAAGGTLAAQQAEGATAVVAQLAAPKLDIEWSGVSSDEGDYVDMKNITPGGSYELTDSYNVVNNGNVASYVRVTVTKYWAEPVNGGFEKNSDLNAGNIDLVPSQNEGWMEVAGLFAGRTKSETQVFYFTSPLAAGASTGSLLDQLELDEGLKNEYSNKGIILQAEADGVQFVQGDNELNAAGILSAWGVTANLDADGNIISVEN